MIALLFLFCRLFLDRESSEGQKNVGSPLSPYETKVFGDCACLSTFYTEVACDGSMVY